VVCSNWTSRDKRPRPRPRPWARGPFRDDAPTHRPAARVYIYGKHGGVPLLATSRRLSVTANYTKASPPVVGHHWSNTPSLASAATARLAVTVDGARRPHLAEAHGGASYVSLSIPDEIAILLAGRGTAPADIKVSIGVGVADDVDDRTVRCENLLPLGTRTFTAECLLPGGNPQSNSCPRCGRFYQVVPIYSRTPPVPGEHTHWMPVLAGILVVAAAPRPCPPDGTSLCQRIVRDRGRHPTNARFAARRAPTLSLRGEH
jgi:hypothetical protein